MAESCAGCHFWRRGNGSTGDCRRRAPVVSPAAGDTHAPRVPWTVDTYWCGEWLSEDYVRNLLGTKEGEQNGKAD